ncbi:toll/interleukin-1 receptor domain-containing protein [Sphingobacterium athyrii]|uniref:TIR domain-containing protein n=1 Tax=Sphingobacterium athyrii TaxID=2152717 RepID=A0A363NTR9_9SPHI|nr:toll/interleukin-1 receptor domain-containing protein [Sphingobacterium athyrii]PUV24157.1 hypothetical protein DCO56_12385 [Sphingobacterium athyrii]
MAIFTKEQFQTIAYNKAKIKGHTTLNENRTFSQSSAKTSVFLSHSHHDKKLIAEAKTFFENLGISIYVDWADETMPQRTSGVTAQNIKGQIRKNDKFILLATNDAITSKWCNWEVGIGDTYKLANDKICILPLADNRLTWQGNEYLQIYPRIEESEYTRDYFKIIYPNKSEISLYDWLKQ